jgi:DNA-binding transcriptional LysR family regulator
LHEPLDQAFELLNRAMQSSVAFDPRVTERTFRIAMSDIAEAYILPRLVSELSRISPFVRVDIVSLLPERAVSSMRSGEIDLAIGAISAAGKDCISVDCLSDRYVCMVRSGHPMAQSKLTRASFAKLRFFFARTTSTIYQLAEQWLADEDVRPRIAARGHFTTAPEIIRHSDLAAIFPRLLALDLHRAKDFRLLELPFDLPAMEVKVHSHARFANDTGIRWMCQTSARLLSNSADRSNARTTRRTGTRI